MPQIDPTALPELAQEYLVDLQVKRLRPRTIAAYLYDLEKFFLYVLEIFGRDASQLRFLSASDFAALKHQDILNFLVRYQGRSPQAQLRKLAALRSFFHYLAVKRGILSSDPTLKVELNTRNQKRHKPLSLTPEQQGRLLQVIQRQQGLPEKSKDARASTIRRDWAIVVLFLTSGLRLSELAGIKLSDLDSNKTSIRVLRKGGFIDTITLHPVAKAALEDYLAHERPKTDDIYPSGDAPLFLNHRTRKAFSIRGIQEMLRVYATAAGGDLRFVSPHKLRHTFGQTLYDETGDIFLVARALAHAQIETAKWYAKVKDEQLREALTSLPVPEPSLRKQ